MVDALQQAIHIKYPHFKEAVEGLVFSLNGRRDSRRETVDVCMGKCSWKNLADKLASDVAMQTLGGPIMVSVSTLKKHRRRAERSKQPKIDDIRGQLDISSRSVAKILLPTEEEHPNGYIQNKSAKDLEAWAIKNSYYVDIDNM
jgi:hypothetical protein